MAGIMRYFVIYIYIHIYIYLFIWEYLIGIFYGIPTSGIMGYLLVGTVSLQGILL